MMTKCNGAGPSAAQAGATARRGRVEFRRVRCGYRLGWTGVTLLGWLAILQSAIPHALAGLGPESCVVVINADSAESRQVANEYARLRQIHPRNLIYLTGVPAGARCSAKDFREKILQPIFQAISERKLDSQIHCVIYSTGFPTQVGFEAWAKDLTPPLEKHQSPIGSLTSMTYLYRWTLAETPQIVGLDTNHYARRGPLAVLEFPFSSMEGQDRFQAAKGQYEAGEWSAAEASFAEMLKEQPFQCGLAYWRARCLARAGQVNESIEALMDAVRRGWRFQSFTESDEELGEVRQSSAFTAALKAMEESYWEFAVPLAFSAQVDWAGSGFPEKADQSPHRYLLSCALGVTGEVPKANTVEEILSALRRSVAADQSRPKGAFYFTSTSDVRTKTRLPNVPAAAKALTALGQKSEIVAAALPNRAPAVLGLTMGASKFDWGASSATLVPGAIGDNLTSFGARFDPKNGQTTLADFIRAGAAGASGTVVEPYAIQNKFPYPLLHAYYARGFSLAESFYLSVNGPYQLLIVGDAMCQPFSQPPKLDVRMGGDDTTVKGVVPLTLQLQDGSPAAGRFDLYMDGLRVGSVAEAGTIRLDTTKHADGYHELRFVAVGSDTTQASSRVIVPLNFANRGREISVKPSVVGDRLTWVVDAPDAQAIKIYAQSELIGEGTGDRYEGAVPVSGLGRGPVLVQARADFGDRTVASPPEWVVLP